MNSIKIEIAREQDSEVIREIYQTAFPEEESAMVAKLAVDLLAEKTVPEIMSLVARESCKASILAPLAVHPKHQQKKVGSRLIESGMKKLKEAGGNIVFVYGDPEFYGKFGFNADTASDFPAPFDLEYPFGWQALILKDWSDKTTPAATSCVRALSDPDLW
jgi:putative acetyltransferase